MQKDCSWAKIAPTHVAPMISKTGSKSFITPQPNACSYNVGRRVIGKIFSSGIFWHRFRRPSTISGQHARLQTLQSAFNATRSKMLMKYLSRSTPSDSTSIVTHQHFQHQCFGEMWTELFTLRPWKNGSPSKGHILVKSQPILKNDMRFGIAKEFPTIWESARLCNFIRLEVVIKNIECGPLRKLRKGRKHQSTHWESHFGH